MHWQWPALFSSVPATGMHLSSSTISAWNDEIDAGIAASRTDVSPANLTERALEVERRLQLELLGEQAREDSLAGGESFQVGGPVRGAPRGVGSSGFEVVRNGNWDAALNLAADPFGIFPDIAGLSKIWVL